jgi:hypothetical protein
MSACTLEANASDPSGSQLRRSGLPLRSRVFLLTGPVEMTTRLQKSFPVCTGSKATCGAIFVHTVCSAVVGKLPLCFANIMLICPSFLDSSFIQVL